MTNKTASKYSLQICNFAIAKEWHPTRNGNLTPRDVTVGSNRKVWWLCSIGHEWTATVNDRGHGNGCPYCSNKKVSDENSQQTVSPALIKEAHPVKDDHLTPTDVTAKSARKAGDDKSLQAVSPALAKEWHPTKNEGLTPGDVAAHSHNLVWWQCSKGHEWKSAVSSRINGQGCFYCSYMQKRKHQ